MWRQTLMAHIGESSRPSSNASTIYVSDLRLCVVLNCHGNQQLWMKIAMAM
jgi:hypothetical protein